MKQLRPVPVFGMKVKVISATPEEVNDSDALCENDYGSYLQETNTIYVNPEMSGEGVFMETLTHEVGHSWMRCSGARNYLRGLLRMTSDEFDLVEENLLRYLSPAILSSIPALADYARKAPK